MKVLHVITGLEAGGAEIQLAMLVRHTRHDADVITLYNPGSVADQIRADGTSVRNLGMRRNTELGALLRLRSMIAAGRYDVVHTHLYRSQIYARPAARLARTPVVLTTEHSIGETHIERREMTAGVRVLYLASELFSDATIAVSDVVRERLVRWGVPARKITVIPNGLETAALAFDPAKREQARGQFGIGPDTYVIGALGRIDENKRVELTVEAAAPMLGERCKILVIGRGDHRTVIEETAARLGVSDHVIFGGFQPDTAAMMAAFDLYVGFLGARDIRAGGTRGDGQRAARRLYGLPGAGWHSDHSGPPGGRDPGSHARGDPQGDRSRTAAARARPRGLRSLRHGVGGAADRRPLRTDPGPPPPYPATALT